MRKNLTFSLLLLAVQSFAQQIENLRPALVSDRIEITYDLVDTEGRTYDLQLFSSLDNYTTPLQYVSGDVGPEIAPGTNKKIIWDAKKELGEISGEIYLEIRGPVTAPFFRLIYPSEGQRIRRGTTTTVTWQSKAAGQLHIDLYLAGSAIERMGATQNTGTYRWTVPKDLQTGKGYNLQFTSVDDPGMTGKSPQFIIGPKYGNGLKIGAATILLGVGVCVISPKTCFGEQGNDPIGYPLPPGSN